MKFKKFYDVRGINEALSNIAHGNGYNTYATTVDLKDAVEDANSTQELLDNLNKLNLVGWYNLEVSRVTQSMVRIKGVDTLGNIRYLEAEFERW